MKRILFISTHNFATNPRLLKEVELALNNQFEVNVICFEFNNWSRDINKGIQARLLERGAVVHLISAGRKPFMPWVSSILKENFYLYLLPFLKNKIEVIARAFFRRHSLIVNALNNVKKADLVVGHNPGTMVACLHAAKLFNCKAGFDMEDYHPGEGHDKTQQHYIRKLIMHVLPKLNYVSFASDQIKNKVEEDLGQVYNHWFSLPNYSPSSQFIMPEQNLPEEKIKLVWFSQNINVHRGLEQILPLLNNYSSFIELHLIGNLNEFFFNEHLQKFTFIKVHKSLPQIALYQKLSEFDIGLALEPVKDLNNDLALSNKILAYFQAGLFILATNTTAQATFLKEFPLHGLYFSKEHNSFMEVFSKLIENIASIRKQKAERYKHAQNESWEKHAYKLLEVWK